jgi:hypothetical protein
MDDFRSGLRGATPSEGLEAGADAFIDECRRIAASCDPNWGELEEAHRVQATISMAVQRVIEWANRNRACCADPETVPTQALLGALSAIGITSALFGYQGEDVAAKARKLIRTSAAEARAGLRRPADGLGGRPPGGPWGPWDA